MPTGEGEAAGPILTLVFTGTAHVRHYYLSTLNKDVAYSQMPARMGGRFYTEGYYDLFDLFAHDPLLMRLDHKTPRMGNHRTDRVDDAVLGYHLSGFGSVVHKVLSLRREGSQKGISEQELFDPTPSQSDTILMADIHSLRDTSPISTLPSGSCLKILGYKKLVIGMEGVSRQGFVDLETYRLKSVFERALPIIRERQPHAAELIESGAAKTTPPAEALVDWGNNVSATLPVVWVGIDQ